MHLAIIAGNSTVITILVEAGLSLNDGYGHPSHLPLYKAKYHDMPWVLNHLVSLGTHENNDNFPRHQRNCICNRLRGRRVIVSERMWEWVGKY
jgi:hypothetical protein